MKHEARTQMTEEELTLAINRYNIPMPDGLTISERQEIVGDWLMEAFASYRNRVYSNYLQKVFN